MNDAPSNHGETVLNPRFIAGIKQPIKPQLPGHFQDSVTGPVFFGIGAAEARRIALRKDIALEGSANELEGFQGQTGDTAVIGMFDGIVFGITEGGADDTDGIGPMGLDFEVQSSRRIHNGYTMLIYVHIVNYNIYKCMATNEIIKPQSIHY
jgi:hypothetical protein